MPTNGQTKLWAFTSKQIQDALEYATPNQASQAMEPFFRKLRMLQRRYGRELRATLALMEEADREADEQARFESELPMREAMLNGRRK